MRVLQEAPDLLLPGGRLCCDCALNAQLVDTAAQLLAAVARDAPVPQKREPLVSVRHLSEYFNVPQRTIRELVKAGKIPAFRIGKLYRFEFSKAQTALSFRRA